MLPIKLFSLLYMTGLLLLAIIPGAQAQRWNPGHAIGTVSGNYYYQYNQTPDQLVEIYPVAIPAVSLTYQWQSSTSLNESGFTNVLSNGTQSSYSPGPLLQTTYFRRISTSVSTGASVTSNIVKLSVVSANWEDRNYIREHHVLVTGKTTWQQVDQLAIGDKLQNTTYLDGLGRPVESVSRETAAPSQSGGLWGDVVQFSQYDELGREPKTYLPYTTTTESGKFKTTTSTEQPQYYTNIYNETNAFSSITFDKSPLSRVTLVKQPGAAWTAGQGNNVGYDMNSAAENVQIFAVDYVQGDAPVNKGAYGANTLYKVSASDENGKQVIQYTDKTGQLILKKVQVDDAPAVAHSGWLCTYYVYDDKGLLRYELSPEAVNYLDTHNWSFAGTDGAQVLNGLCSQYYYDEKGRTTWKKMPDAAGSNMMYDMRDRLVFTQDGNQAALSTPQWTAYLYDDLDRPVVTALYNTSKTSSALQTDITNANNSTTVVSTTVQGNTINTTTYSNPVASTDLNNASVSTIVKYQFYDDYSFAGVKTFNTGFTNLSAYSTSDPNVLPIVTSKRTLSLPTGSLTRVLGATTFLASTLYYEEKGHSIQSLEDNIKSGVDITTWQYHFCGRLLSTCSDHTTSGTGFTNFITLGKYNFDKLGRVSSIDKQFGSNAFKTVASYEYDDIGRVKAEHLDPAYNANGAAGLEVLNYNFNIHNQITGVNKDYALKTPGSYNKWGHFFGMYLGYDNRDGVFARAQLNGQVTGVLWNTQGDDAQRKYDYSYDNANRLIKADFGQQQHPGDGYSNSTMDFSVNGTGGKITYDLNGNLLSMLQKGVIPGNATPITIDDLAYAYQPHSNKLKSVTDNMTMINVNGQLGDFKDGSNGTAADYVYDNNGNVVIDLNKNAKDLENVAGTNGISYNYLDKPERIRIAGKGTIRIVYSANGEKLQRAFIPEAGGDATITTYIGSFVYQQTGAVTATAAPPFLPAGGTLSYINFEGGRIRAIQPVTQDNGLDGLQIAGNITLPDGRSGVFDYFITDYQKNVRMILTEETHAAYNTCTMETPRASAEDPVFGQTGGANEVETTRFPTPSAWTNTGIGSSVSRLGNIAGHNIGPNTLQKVMAGDQVSTTVQYYYQTATGGSNPNYVSTLLTSLAQAITGSGAASDVLKANVTPIQNQLNGTSGFVNAVQPTGDGTNTPQAYLTILFFDERFKFIEAVDGGVAQQQVGSSVGSDGLTLGLGSIKAPKNGYVYVYVSNLSDQDVYFDNFKVGITRGNIIEENHYYAYGLRITGISSKKAGLANEGLLKNNYQYQGQFSELDEDLGWNDFALRNYDPQTGRWVQQDPYDEFASPYTGMGNDPVNNIDPNGGSIFEGLTLAGRLTITTFLGAAGGMIASHATGRDSWGDVGLGAAVGLAAGFGLNLHIAATLGIQTMNHLATVFKSTSNTIQVGVTISGAIGKGAWEIKNKWNTDYINKYHQAIPQIAQTLMGEGSTYTCEDFAITCIVTFARDNNLPFKFITGAETFDASSNKYLDFNTFLHYLRMATGAPDLQRPENTTSINQDDLGAGSLVLLTHKNNNVAHHVQMVTNVYKEGGILLGVNVKQGNFGPSWRPRKLGSADPTNPFYYGASVQIGYWNVSTNVYTNFTLHTVTNNFSTAGGNYLEFKNFNFLKWNE